MYEGSIEDSKVAQQLSKKLREMTDKLKTTIVIIHHTHKLQNNGPLTIHNIAGSRILAQESDFMIGMNRTIDNKRYIKDIAFRYAPDDSETVKVFNLDDNLWINVTKEEDELKLISGFDNRKDDTNAIRILGVIAEKTMAGLTISTDEIKSQFVDSGEMSYQTAFTHLKKLQDEGKINRVAKGVYKAVV